MNERMNIIVISEKNFENFQIMPEQIFDVEEQTYEHVEGYQSLRNHSKLHFQKP